MIALIAEKPSVAKDIARIIGATQKNDGYLSGNGYMVTWAFGHLIQLAMPEAYGIEGFKRENLPILPETFILEPRRVKSGQTTATEQRTQSGEHTPAAGDALNARVAAATEYNEADYKAYNELKAEYDHQMHEWEKASYELEITEGE